MQTQEERRPREGEDRGLVRSPGAHRACPSHRIHVVGGRREWRSEDKADHALSLSPSEMSWS